MAKSQKTITSYNGIRVNDTVKTVDQIGTEEFGLVVGFKEQRGNDFQLHTYILVQYSYPSSDGIFKTTRPMSYKQIKKGIDKKSKQV